MHNLKIENLRALTILIVVIGHSIILYDPSWQIVKTDVECAFLHKLKCLINVIQMPLFFCISGYLYNLSIKKYTFSSIFFNKIRRLIIPFLLILFLYTDPIKLLLGVPGYDNAYSLLKSHTHLGAVGHLWFLPVLFYYFLFFYYPLKLSNRYQILIFSGLILTHEISNKLPGLFLINEFCFNGIYFYSGCLLNRFESSAVSITKNLNKIFIIALIITIFALHSYLPRFIEPLSVITAILLIYKITPGRKLKFISIISVTSFGIYLFHSPLVYITYMMIPNASPLIICATNICAWGGVALALTLCVKKTRFKFLIGE